MLAAVGVRRWLRGPGGSARRGCCSARRWRSTGCRRTRSRASGSRRTCCRRAGRRRCRTRVVCRGPRAWVDRPAETLLDRGAHRPCESGPTSTADSSSSRLDDPAARAHTGSSNTTATGNGLSGTLRCWSCDGQPAKAVPGHALRVPPTQMEDPQPFFMLPKIRPRQVFDEGKHLRDVQKQAHTVPLLSRALSLQKLGHVGRFRVFTGSPSRSTSMRS